MFVASTISFEEGVGKAMNFNKLFVIAVALLVAACDIDPPQPNVELAASSDETQKNQIARGLVQDLRDTYGRDAILTISSQSPRGRDFSKQVRAFARRAAVSYTDTAPDFFVFYEIENVDGYLTGPQIVNFVLTANFIRPVSVNAGSEILFSSSLRGRCRRGDDCKSTEARYAEAALYSFRRK